MCEIFGFSADRTYPINEYLKTFYSHSDKHPHGWGLACVSKRSALIEKESLRALDSHYLRERLSQPIEEKIVLAHIRYATIGNVERKNCHPYSDKDNSGRVWTLIHNGTIFDYPPLESYVKKQKGDTDSERIFLYILDKINLAQQNKNSALNFEERFRLLDCIVKNLSKGNKLNLILTDGSYVYAHTNCKNTLYYLQKDGKTIISTQPLDKTSWEKVPFTQLLAYKNGKLQAQGTVHGNEYVENEEQIKMLYQIFSNL
ncbi:MAG: class II glutamine amidotransferase [Ruminococcus sp.]|nr:class II glutamine amidotransferase [Ruminococcus sp.]